MAARISTLAALGRSLDGDWMYSIEAADVAVAGSAERRAKSPVKPGSLVVAPLGADRMCAATRETLAFLTASVARGHNDAGDGTLGMLRHSSAQFAKAPVYQSGCCWMLASRIRQLQGHPSSADQYIYTIAGRAGLAMSGRSIKALLIHREPERANRHDQAQRAG